MMLPSLKKLLIIASSEKFGIQNTVNRILNSVLLAVCGLCVVGCASTVKYVNYKQVVRVRSVPPGAKILHEGKVIGTTPDYVEFRRGLHENIEIEYKGQKIKHKFDSRYRWSESFVPNMILLPYAPIGWGVDFATKNTWLYPEPAPFVFSKGAKEKNIKKIPEKDWVIAVSPPRDKLDDEEVIGEMGEKLVRLLASDYPKAKVLNFKKTQKAYQIYGFDHEESARPPEDELDKNKTWWRSLVIEESRAARARVIKEFGVTHIFESKIRRNKEGLQLRGQLKNVYDDRTVGQQGIRLSPDDLSTLKHRAWLENAGGWLYFIPNNVALDFGSVKPILTIEGDEFEADNSGDERAIDEVLRVLGAINAHRIQAPTKSWNWKFVFNIVPSGFISLQNFEYPDISQVDDIQFRRFIAGVGYGPQVGMNSRNGFAYFNIQPGVNWSQIRWDNGGDIGRVKRWSINIVAEIGYSYFLTDSLNIRAFSRFVSENDELWKEAFNDSTGLDFNFDSVGYRFVGLSMGYYFPAADHPLRGWFD